MISLKISSELANTNLKGREKGWTQKFMWYKSFLKESRFYMDFLSLIPHTLKGLAMFSEKKVHFVLLFLRLKLFFLSSWALKSSKTNGDTCSFFVLQILFVQIR